MRSRDALLQTCRVESLLLRALDTRERITVVQGDRPGRFWCAAECAEYTTANLIYFGCLKHCNVALAPVSGGTAKTGCAKQNPLCEVLMACPTYNKSFPEGRASFEPNATPHSFPEEPQTKHSQLEIGGQTGKSGDMSKMCAALCLKVPYGGSLMRGFLTVL